MRALTGVVADARDRPSVLLVVPVALASAAACALVCSARVGTYPLVRAGSRRHIPRTGATQRAVNRDPVAIRRVAAPVCVGQSPSWRRSDRDGGLCGCGAVDI